jgi:hypothetical protein
MEWNFLRHIAWYGRCAVTWAAEGRREGEALGWAWRYDTSLNILFSNSEVFEDDAWVMGHIWEDDACFIE